jgi:CotH kinase protein
MRLTRLRALAAATIVALLLPASSIAQTTTDPADPFFDDSVLQDIFITINSRDWAGLKEHFLENTYYPCDFKWNGTTVRNIGIRSRGTGSRSGTKPGLRVDFDRYTTDQKFLGLKSFILRNNTQDASGMRERLSMLMFRRMGMVAEREAHARLFINNVYSGLYTIVESIDKTFLKKQFAEDDGHLYEFSFDNTEGATVFNFSYPGSDPALYTPAPFKPETLESDPQGEVLERLFWTINNAGDAVWRTSMAEFLDLNKFMRHLGIENFLAEEDGITGDYGPNNFYFYRFVNTTKFQFLPWDKSNTFWTTPYFIFQNISNGIASHRNVFVQRALGYTDLRDLYLDTILECANSILADPSLTPRGLVPPGVVLVPAPAGQPGWLETEVARVYDQIRQASLDDPVKPFTNDQFEQSYLDLKNFAQHRAEFVRQQVTDDRASRGR